MLNILSGYETGNIKSFPIANGQVFDQGDWVKFDGKKLVKMENSDVFTGDKGVFPVYAGNKSFYDTRYLQEVDVVTASSCILETDKMEAGIDFNAGDAVFVKGGVVVDKDTAGVGAKAVGYAIEPSGLNVEGKKIVKFARA